MDEMQMVRELLPPPPPPSPEVVRTARARAGGRGGLRARQGRRRAVAAVTTVAAVAAAAAAVAVAGAAGGGGARPGAGTAAKTNGVPVLLSARQVLLTAAANVAKGAPSASGRYWRIQTVGAELMPLGTAGLPYDMAFATSTDEWNARASGQHSRWINQQLGARPATSADATAWRAAGSPGRWLINQLWDPVHQRFIGEYQTAAATPPVAQNMDLRGAVGEAVGDGTPLTAAQFAAFPADPVKLRALMIHYADLDYAAVGGPDIPMSDVLLTEAVNLLRSPLSPQAEAAVYKVLADLPGSRSLGPMRDALGRTGYGVAIGDSTFIGADAIAGKIGVGVVIIDPATGKLLATEIVVTKPGLVSLGNKPTQQGKVSAPSAVGRIPKRSAPPAYHGRVYQGEVWQYTAIISAGWTNATPPH